MSPVSPARKGSLNPMRTAKGGILTVDESSELARSFEESRSKLDQSRPWTRSDKLTIGLLGFFVPPKTKWRAQNFLPARNSKMALLCIILSCIGALSGLAIGEKGKACDNEQQYVKWMGSRVEGQGSSADGGLRLHELRDLMGQNQDPEYSYCEINPLGVAKQNGEYKFQQVGVRPPSAPEGFIPASCVMGCDIAAGDQNVIDDPTIQNCQATFPDGMKVMSGDREVWLFNALNAFGTCTTPGKEEGLKWWKEEGWKNPGGHMPLCGGVIVGFRNICKNDQIIPNILAVFPYTVSAVVIGAVMIFLRPATKDTVEDLFMDPTARLNRKVDLLFEALTTAAQEVEMKSHPFLSE